MTLFFLANISLLPVLASVGKAAGALAGTTAGSVAGSVPMVAQPTVVLSYQAWKTEQVDEAQMALDRILAEKLEPNAKTTQKQSQAEKSLDFAKELSINEYLNIYVAGLKSRETVAAAAKRLTPDEITEVLLAFQKLAAEPRLADAQGPRPR